METEKLYYEDPYLTAFTGRVAGFLLRVRPVPIANLRNALFKEYEMPITIPHPPLPCQYCPGPLACFGACP